MYNEAKRYKYLERICRKRGHMEAAKHAFECRVMNILNYYNTKNH